MPAEFTGRSLEIAAVVRSIRDGMTRGKAISTISSIEGMSGIGKTALANVIGHALLPEFPDAQLFIELGAHSHAPLTPVQALSRVLYAFYPDARLPEDERQLRGMYLSALQGKHALVILDDARDDAHVEMLLPPTGCAAIITSRRSLRTGESLTLNVLKRDEAIMLLRSLCQRIADDADTLARLCGDLPIALTIVGGHLKQYKTKPVREYIADLQRLPRVPQLKNEQVQLEALFDYSYKALQAKQRTALHALSVMPADFDRTAAIAVIGMADESAAVLDELVALNLVLYDEKTLRYRWHDLLREFVFSHASSKEVDAAAGRHATHYVTALSAANDLYLKGGAAITQGLALYDQEADHIRAGQAWVSNHVTVDRKSAQLCSKYSTVGAYVLDLRLHPREQIKWLKSAITAARQLGDHGAEGAHLGNLGVAYTALGDPRQAIQCHNQVLVISRKFGDRRGEGNALGGLGSAYADLGDTRCAVWYCKQQLVIVREIGDRRGEEAALGNLGSAYTKLGYTRCAIQFFEQQLVIVREIGDQRGEGNALGSLGIIYNIIGNAEHAIELQEQALEIFQRIGDRQGEGNVLGNLGIAYAKLLNTQRAIEYHEQALQIHHQIGYHPGEVRTAWNLGTQYAKQGDLKRAIPLMQVRVDYERELGHPDAYKLAHHVEELRAKLAGN